MNKEIEIKWTINIVPSSLADVDKIQLLIKSAPDALLVVSNEEIEKWIKNDQSIVAKNQVGKIVGHQGMMVWETENPKGPFIELRSAFVDPCYRGQGLNTKMKETMIEKALEKYPEAVMVGVTESASQSRGILQKMGFNEVPLDEAFEDVFSICPDNCYKKTGVDCGCKIYYLYPKIK